MTEMQPYQVRDGVARQTTTVDRMQDMFATLQTAMRMTNVLVDTELCPVGFWPLPRGVERRQCPNPRLPWSGESPEVYDARRRTAAATMAGIIAQGAELDLPWSAAVTGIYIIGGKPTLYAELAVALLKSRGHTIEVREMTAERCIVYGKHRRSEVGSEFTFTFEDAVTAGYVPGVGPNQGRAGGNARYMTNRSEMLYARCALRACRVTAPEDLRGIAGREEVEDDLSVPTEPAEVIRVNVDPAVVGSETAVQDVVRRAARPEPEVEQVSPAPDPAGPATAATLQQISGRFTDFGVTGEGMQARRRAFVQHVVGRNDVQRMQQLTEGEAGRVLTELLGEPWVVDRFENPAYYGPDGKPLEPGTPDQPATDDNGSSDHE